ncbi:MAG TPA: glucan 1,4-alpha-glucosidase [Bacteroidota bacterium]
MALERGEAPGRPGIPPRWTSSAKSGVGTALGLNSRVWFTISHGILNEVYYPRVDRACTRDLGLIVTDGQDFFSEEKRQAGSAIQWEADGIPAFRLTNTCFAGRYRIEKEILADPLRDVVLQQIRFVPLQGTLLEYHLFALLAPHLSNYGSGNTAWTGQHKGVPALFAERDGTALALLCSVPWKVMSAGYVGTSDGWQDLARHKQMQWAYERAESGNVALTGEIDLAADGGSCTLALGFGADAAEAGHRALASLQDGFASAKTLYCSQWQEWQRSFASMSGTPTGGRDLYRISTAVLSTHAAPNFPGAMIAGLSIPWGFSKGDDDLGGYHLVWPRDLVESAGALLAAGADEKVRRTLFYLQTTQEADGHWSQNMWIDGTPYWQGVQMDETALPVLLVDLARREGALEPSHLQRLWPMVRKAARFLLLNGPVTQEDRWEEDPGYSPFTLATEVAALLAAADQADIAGEPALGTYLRETADAWNGNIEQWMYVQESELGRRLQVDGYYVRVAPLDVADGASPLLGYVPIKNRPPSETSERAESIVSPDALALVRFGLRAANDPRILSTVKAIDALLRVDTPAGPAWHRYNDDGYGEHADGAPFDGTGIGRAWPLLSGERAHYELAAGNRAAAVTLLKAMEGFASDGGLLPEQIWDSADIPAWELVFGRPSGSAMPLAWAHAEYLKLRRSLQDGRVFDTPPQTVERYLVEHVQPRFHPWRFNQKCRTMPAGRALRLEVLAGAVVRWSTDGWANVHDTAAQDRGIGIWTADLPTASLSTGGAVDFTFHWVDSGHWEGTNFRVTVA